jgi:hypothetical protein
MNNSRIIWPTVSLFGSLKSFHIARLAVVDLRDFNLKSQICGIWRRIDWYMITELSEKLSASSFRI